jgi:hypothetical protein
LNSLIIGRAHSRCCPENGSLVASDQLTTGVRKSDSARTVNEKAKDFLKMNGALFGASATTHP